MFFIYLLLALIAAIFVYIDSEKTEMPRWWAAIIFFAPVTMIYYIVKTRRRKSLIPLTLFLLVFVLVGIGEYFLYTRLKDKIIYSSYSPTAREVLRFTNKLKYSVKQLNDATLYLEKMTSVNASPDKINEARKFISEMQSQLEENDIAVKNFILIVNDYRNLLIEEKFDWLLRIEEYYNEPVVTKYLNNFALYLEAFSALLKYTGVNFQEINARIPVYLKNYDGYYINYVRALESHNRIDIGRMQFQHNFLVHYSELEPYLPAILQKKFVNIWNTSK